MEWARIRANHPMATDHDFGQFSQRGPPGDVPETPKHRRRERIDELASPFPFLTDQDDASPRILVEESDDPLSPRIKRDHALHVARSDDQPDPPSFGLPDLIQLARQRTRRPT